MLKSLAKTIFPPEWLSYHKRQVIWLLDRIRSPKGSLLRFTCNICGERTSYPRGRMMRETSSCVPCGSTVRLRSIIHTLSMELFGKSLAMEDFPLRKDLSGVGMSDWPGYAERLAVKLSYVNTYYHQEPLLDISSPTLRDAELYDFIIATEVFEHVSQPIALAFQNAHRLLKPGGVFIFSVPYVEGETREHFPELWHYTISKENDTWVLANETSDGRQQRFEELTFHGGPGTTVEMRLFGKDALRKNFTDAGFRQVHMYAEEVGAFGIVWNPYVAEEAPYRPFIYGLDTPPWSARKE